MTRLGLVEFLPYFEIQQFRKSASFFRNRPIQRNRFVLFFSLLPKITRDFFVFVSQASLSRRQSESFSETKEISVVPPAEKLTDN